MKTICESVDFFLAATINTIAETQNKRIHKMRLRAFRGFYECLGWGGIMKASVVGEGRCGLLLLAAHFCVSYAAVLSIRAVFERLVAHVYLRLSTSTANLAVVTRLLSELLPSLVHSKGLQERQGIRTIRKSQFNLCILTPEIVGILVFRRELAVRLLWVTCSISQAAIASDQVPIGDLELQEIGLCNAAFEANRAKVGTAITATEGRYTSVHRLDPSKSYVTRERTVIGWFVDRNGDGVSVIRRADVSGDMQSPIGPVDSDSWRSLISSGSSRYLYYGDTWTDLKRDEGKKPIPFIDRSFDPFCIAASPVSCLALRLVDEDLFAKCTPLNQLSEVKLTKEDIIGRWIGDRNAHSYVVRFDRHSRMPVECELCLGRDVVGKNGEKRRIWDISLGRTRAFWSKKKAGVWTVDRVNLTGTSTKLHREWEIELRWAFGDDVDRKWFDVQAAPEGHVVFNVVWNGKR